MNILCAICQDTLEPSNDIFITPCGHVFHFPCLIQWLEKAQNCPQCRQKVKRDSIIRIYFNFYNTETVKEDSFTLQQKVDSLSFQIKLKETEYNTCREENAVLKRQNGGLRDEVKKTESEITQKNSVIHALKEQSLYFKQKCQDLDKIREEKNELQNKLEACENLKILINSTSEEADKMLSQTRDPATLCTYLGVMKRELSVSLEKRKELRSMVKILQQQLQTLKMKRNSFSQEYIKRIEQLEDEISICQSEKDILTKRLSKLECEDKNSDEQSEESKPCSENNVSRKRETDGDFRDDVSSPKKIKRATEKIKLSLSADDKNDSDIVLVSPGVKKIKENEENSPYLPTKSKSMLALKERDSQRSTFSVGSKRTLLSSKKSGSIFKNSREKNPDITFDGFGGHSKIETFPVSKSTSNKFKRPSHESSKTKKIKLDLGNNKQLDDHIINLT